MNQFVTHIPNSVLKELAELRDDDRLRDLATRPWCLEVTYADKTTVDLKPLSHYDECYDENGDPYPYGRCDTCGAPCNEGGCTKDQGHEIALA